MAVTMDVSDAKHRGAASRQKAHARHLGGAHLGEYPLSLGQGGSPLPFLLDR
jgi:hypothetical protein